MSYGDDFTLTLFTNDPSLAARADGAGINRIGVDIERIGKYDRQGHLTTWISNHDESDLTGIRDVLRQASLFTRCNLIHDRSAEEIDRLLERGVKVLMLPYFKTVNEAEQFIRLVDDRAHVVLLLETMEAVTVLPELCRLPEIVEIHVGLNDLRLSLGWPSHFHVLVSEYLERICEKILDSGHRLGIGGLGRAGDNNLPIPSNLVIAQIPRLGGTAALVSRAFFRPPVPEDMDAEVWGLRKLLDQYQTMPTGWLIEKRDELARLLEATSVIR
jgi:hypothetical protein